MILLFVDYVVVDCTKNEARKITVATKAPRQCSSVWFNI